MNKKEILKLSGSDLYHKFVESVLSNAFGMAPIVSELEQSERFNNDFIFRIHIQTAAQFIAVSFQKYEKVLEKAEELIDRAHALDLPKLLTLNYHILAISYKNLGFFEKAIESFMYVLKYAKMYNLNNLTSIVYYYIGEIYMVHDDINTAIGYINQAFEVLEDTKEHEPRYQMKKIMFSSIMIQLLYEAHKIEDMEQYIEIMKEHFSKDSSLQAAYTHHVAMLFYLLAKKEFSEAKRFLYETLSLLGDDPEIKLQLLKTYCAILSENSADPGLYREELFLFKELGESRMPYINYALNNYLHEYYEKSGDRESSFESLKKSFESIEKEMVDLKRNKVNSFNLIKKNFSIQENISSVQQKNMELKLMAEEAIRNKVLAESTLHRLAVVSELGKKLTHSLDVSDIIKIVYKKLIKSIPMSNFVIMVKSNTGNQLESIAYYANGRVKDKFFIDYDDRDSAFVETFKTNRFMMIEDFNENVRFEKQRKNTRGSFFRSVLFFPLQIGDEVLGVCSVQHSKPYMYKADHIEFLEELMPYLAIALNNAFKSEALEREIGRHEKTQKELEKLNQKLETLSYVDGLTQISNRRDFEKRILEYLKKAKKNGSSISLYMFDIDNFKVFNDTYGHLLGDKVLKSVATIIQKRFDEVGGISARFGGEEFVAACLQLDEEQSIALGERIKDDVFKLGVINENAPLKRLSISVGVSYSKGMEDLKKSLIMRWADVSLYNAKRTGKNKVVLKVIKSKEDPPEILE